MMEIVDSIAGIAIMNYAQAFSWHSLEERKIDYRNYKLYIVLFASIIFLMMIVSLAELFFKIVCTTMISITLSYYLMHCDIKRTILMSIMTQIIIMISETGLAVFLSFLGVDINALVNLKFGGFAFNASVSIIVILFSMIGFFPKLYRVILKRTDKINSEYFIAFSLAIILIANILAANVYQKIDFKFLLIFNTCITILYFVVIIHSFSNKNNYLKVYDKYNTTLSSLKQYEDILNRYRISSHENKNQLLTVRNMIKNKEKNIPEYIDAIIENKLKDDEKLMQQSTIIPAGGLRGLIYSKMLLMNSKNIDFDLSIDKGMRTMELISLGEQTLLDICTIMGVFLDNAIEAVDELEEKFIDLEMNVESKKLYISVTNNFEGVIDLDHISDKGFSSKGGSHGYGLSLVKELVDFNDLLQNKRTISHDEFTQTLIVEMENIQK